MSSSVRRTECHFEAPDGTLLFRRGWLPAVARRVLVVVHGLAEHSGRYEAFGAWFACRGAAVHAYDQRGHGRSAGRRVHVERFAQLVDDLGAFLERVRSEHAGLPATVVGHSLGGLVVAALLVRRPPGLAGAVLCAPALPSGRSVPLGRRLWLQLLGRLAPRLRLGIGIDAQDLSRDPAVVRGYLEDPLVERRLSARLAAEILAARAGLASAGPEFEAPLLLLHGEADRICPSEASQAFQARCGDAVATLRLYPELRHEPFNEPEREQVFEDVRDWLEGLQRPA